MREMSAEAEALWRTVEVALSAANPSGGSSGPRVMAQLVKLARVSPEGSDAWAYAHRELAARLVLDDPWRASACARRALSHTEHDAMSWGILGLAQTTLGNYPYAVRAYRDALRHEPNNPWYAHNLGHLLDVVDDRADEAVSWLERALAHLGQWPEASRRHRMEIEASLAHALWRAGRLAAAHARMRSVIQSGLALKQHHALYGQIRESLESSLERRMNLDAEGAAPRPEPRRVRRRAATRPGSGGTD